MFGIDGSNLMSIASIAGAALTGGSSLMMMAATQAASQVGSQALGNAMESLGFDSGIIDMALNAFQSGFAMGSGNFAAMSAEVQELAQSIIQEANNQGAGGAFTGDLDRAINDMQDATQQILQSLIDARRDAEQGEDVLGGAGADGEGQSWLVAIAEALGEQMGKHAANMVEYANDMNNLTGGGDDPEAAREFAAVQAKMQGEAQMFSIASQTMSTTVKAIGEGLSGVARKQ